MTLNPCGPPLLAEVAKNVKIFNVVSHLHEKWKIQVTKYLFILMHYLQGNIQNIPKVKFVDTENSHAE